MKKQYIFTKSAESNQVIDVDFVQDDVVEPFIAFDSLLDYYYNNSYHRRCIKIKASILSQTTEHSGLENLMPEDVRVADFLNSFVTELEIYGNAFVEDTGKLFILPTIEARLKTDKTLIQRSRFLNEDVAIEGHHLRYYSPNSRYYGEPDYSAVLEQILLEKQINGYNNAFFENSARPDFAIIFEGSEPSDEQITAFQEFFETSFQGYANAHKTLIISAPPDTGSTVSPRIRIEPLNTVQDMSFKALKDTNRDEIISAHGVPPRLAGIVTAGQLGGGGELIGQLHVFNEIEIKPKQAILQAFFKDVIGVDIEPLPMDVTNFKSDVSVVAGLVQTGVITPAEAKMMMGINQEA